MSDNIFYSDIIISKSGIEIPVFNNGKTVDSRYDPQRESIRLSDQIKDKTNFVIVLGIASGILIKSILEKRCRWKEKNEEKRIEQDMENSYTF